MAQANDKPSLKDLPEMKVMIRNPQGKYLAQDANGLFFTEERKFAVVLRYLADHVQEQLETIRRSYGISLVVDPVPMEEVYERCDQCHELFMPYMLFFNGTRFLCAECRQPNIITPPIESKLQRTRRSEL
jgi:hypothetical protein